MVVLDALLEHIGGDEALVDVEIDEAIAGVKRLHAANNGADLVVVVILEILYQRLIENIDLCLEILLEFSVAKITRA